MPSRKKAKGKARKAAKEAKAKEEESRAVISANQREEGSLEAQMKRLMISAVSPTMCKHGCPSLSAGEEKRCLEFIDAFIASFNSSQDYDVGLGLLYLSAVKVTEKTYADVYDSKLEAVISIVSSCGTQCILDGENQIAQLYAAAACFFEEYMAVKVLKTKAAANWAKIIELNDADDHTLVSYYRKRISCSCLDETYKSVKSVKKMGHCFNPGCSLPGRKIERSKMFSCTRCGLVNYCSVECQKADWKGHSSGECDKVVRVNAAFHSQKS